MHRGFSLGTILVFVACTLSFPAMARDPAETGQNRRGSATGTIDIRDHASCDGTTDDGKGLQEALSLAVETGRTLDFGSAKCTSGRQLLAADGDVSIVAHANSGSVRFTSARSAGFAFLLRHYEEGRVDRFSLEGLTIIAGAIHQDAALKVGWRKRVPNGERMLNIQGLTIRPDRFGTHSFSHDLSIDAAFNGSIVDLLALGNAAASGTSIRVSQSVSITFARPNVHWRAVAAHFTTGAAEGPQPQSEGLSLDHPVFYNVNRCVLIDGRSTMSLNMIDFSWAHGHCAANQGSDPMAFDFNLVAQSHVTGSTIYVYPGAGGMLARLRSVSESNFASNFFLSGGNRPTGRGLRFEEASVGNRIVANRISNFSVCLEFGAENDTANLYALNQFNACTQPVVDKGMANTDGGNSVSISSTVIRKSTLAPR